MGSPYPAPTVPTVSTMPAPPTAPPPPMPPAQPGNARRVALLVIITLAIIAALAGSLTATASAARALAYPKPAVSISDSASNSSHVGDSITFQAMPTAGRDLVYQWDFGDGATATGAEVSHTYNDYQQGGYSVSLEATDPLGQQASATKALALLPPTPVASFTYQIDPNNPLAVFFDASQSTGYNLTYQWDFGDNNTSQDPQPENDYSQLGTYTVRLTVTDAVGQTNSTTQTVTLQVTPPTASFTATQDYNDGFGDACYTFDASASTGFNLTYNWDFGDGNTDNNGSSQVSECYYSSGSYHVTLTVVDGVNQSAHTSQYISY